MPSIASNSIADAKFRANPNYELVLFDRLPSEQQEVLSDLQKDPDFYGILAPRQPAAGLRMKSVCRDTALLYFTLQEPGRLPAYVKATLGEECNQAIAELILDGVLEVEWNETFVSGSQAYSLIYSQKQQPSRILGKIAQLSLDALKYAQALEIDQSSKLSSRLYFYNRLPVSAYWKRKFSTPEAVVEYLGIDTGSSHRLLLEQNWQQLSPPPENQGWLIWQSRQFRPVSPKPQYTYKLYISPSCEFLRDAFQTTVKVLSESPVSQFKIGQDVYGLLRPDKLVAYFWSFEALEEAATCLMHKLEGIPAHGVPFTAEIAGNGLLSWGIDPPKAEQVLSWQARESWRLWVTNRLAVALLAAKSAPSEAVEPWQFAIERLRLEGVDTESWTPTATIWNETA